MTARKEGQDTDLTLYARQYKRHIMWAWAEALQQHFVPEEVRPPPSAANLAYVGLFHILLICAHRRMSSVTFEGES